MTGDIGKKMYVTKRNGRREEVSFDKVLHRIQTLAVGLDHVNPVLVAQKVCSQIHDGIQTAELDDFAAETAAMMVGRAHPNYGKLAACIAIDNHHKNTPDTFVGCVAALHTAGVVSQKLLEVSKMVGIQEMIDYNRDFELFDYFGFKTLEKSYLQKVGGKVVERPQHMWMRVAVDIHTDEFATEHYGYPVQYVPNMRRIAETYDALSKGYFIHATPTLFNAGTNHTQLSSCFLLDIEEDSIRGIYKTLGDCAQISKWAGGVGLAIHKIRAKNSRINGTNGASTGIVPMLKVYNDTARYVNQGGKRNGSFAVYLEPWHADIEDFLRLKLNTGAEEDRARDLFYGLWIPDEFMQRVKEGKDWTLMCPNECPGLADVHSEEFTTLYRKYEEMGMGRKTIPAQKLWQMILDAQIQTGTPYLCYKDAGNSKSNQKNLGTIKSSNLCSEVFEYTDAGETAVCNLGSISLTKFVKEDLTYDYEALRHYTAVLARNLDTVIDRNYYPTLECKASNMRNRPIGIGVQGLADVFAKMKITWGSPEAADVNRRIFEHIYYASVHTSYNIAVDKGSYPSFQGSPASEGILQPDLWRVNPLSDDLDWQGLRQKIRKGLRNSLSIALMPTASTSQILGNNECFEPFTSNLYVRHVLAGDFIVINKYLISELVDLGLWTPELRTAIIANNGSVQNVVGIPPSIQERYRTAWEIPMKTIIDFSADRAPFVCQSQSLNLFVADPSYARISSMHMYAWQKGLKTGCYYLRTKAVASAQKFTVEPEARSPPPDCLTCSA
uniref:ribonucleoside-diphosphate reductase n=1 Tax=viral metagenome TaxID=1070528 RepID=A0A6C0AJA8_9ZZZZ